jgi:hypothetical protein
MQRALTKQNRRTAFSQNAYLDVSLTDVAMLIRLSYFAFFSLDVYSYPADMLFGGPPYTEWIPSPKIDADFTDSILPAS